MEACVTFKTCGDTSKVAATLPRHQHCQSLSIMFMRFMLYVLSKHAEKHQDTPAKQQLSLHKTSAAMQTWARSRSTEPPMSPQTAANQHKQPSEEPMRAADSPLEERGWSRGGLWGERSSSEVVLGEKESWSQETSAVTPVLEPEWAWVVILEPDWLLWRRRHRQVRLVRLINNQGLILGEGG